MTISGYTDLAAISAFSTVQAAGQTGSVALEQSNTRLVIDSHVANEYFGFRITFASTDFSNVFLYLERRDRQNAGGGTGNARDAALNAGTQTLVLNSVTGSRTFLTNINRAINTNNASEANAYLIDPDDNATFAYADSGAFAVGAVTSLEWRWTLDIGAINGQQHLTDAIGLINKTTGLVYTGGTSGSPSGLATIISELPGANMEELLRSPATDAYVGYLFFSIGDSSTETHFEENNVFTVFPAAISTINGNEQNKVYSSRFGFRVNQSAVDSFSVRNSLLSFAGETNTYTITFLGTPGTADLAGTNLVGHGQVVLPGVAISNASFSGGSGTVSGGTLTSCVFRDNTGEFAYDASGLSSINDLAFNNCSDAVRVDGDINFNNIDLSNNTDDIHTDESSGTITVAVDAASSTDHPGGFNDAGYTAAKVNSAGATVNIVAPTVAVTIPVVSGSRIKIYDTGTTTLIDGVNSSGASFVWESGSAGSGYDIYVVNPGRESVFRENFIYPSSSQTLTTDQPVDINYLSTASAYDLTLDGTGLGSTTDIWLDASGSALEIGIATGNNLAQPAGITFQLLYSFIIESRHTNDELMPFHDPIVAISATAGEFELRRGTTLKDTATRNLLRSGGFARYSAADALEAVWLDATGLLNLASSGTIYYWFGSATNPTLVNTINAGVLNQVIQIFGDASNGNFDFRTGTELTFSIREQGENTSTYRLFADQLTPQSITELRPQAYSIPLTTTTNPNIAISDVSIDANSDGTADVAPFDGMSVTYLEGSGFGAWTDSTVYAANAIVSDSGRWYITTAGGTSSGTGVGDDTGVTDWSAYSGERQIDGTYYAFNIIYDANNGTLEQMTAYLFWLVRQNVDIDAGTANRTGRAADPIASTRGSDLVMATGGVIDNFNTSAQLTHIPVDVGGVERAYPAPPNQIVISGIPSVTNAVLAVQNLTTSAVTYPTLSGGGATIELDEATNYKFSADAPGYLRQSVTLPGNTPTFAFTLEDFRSLYDSGTDRSADIAFNYSTLEVTVGDGTANLSFADVFRTIEDYLSTAQGVLFDFPPFPVVVDVGGGNGRNYLFFPYDTTNDQVNPVRIKPDPTNTSDPTLTNFVIVLEQATAPLFDVFDFTAAGGRTIRFQTEAVAASVTVSGSGALTSQQNTWLETLFNTTTDGTGAKAFSSTALANASSGGSGGDDAATIYSYFTDTNREDAFKADVSGLSTHSATDVWAVGSRTVTGGTIDTNNDMRGTDNALLSASYIAPDNAGIAAIPTNPLLTSDSRLNNLNAPIGDIPTNPLTALPSIPNDWITAAGIAADAIAEIQNGLSTFDHTSNQVTVATNNDKSNYSLTQAFPSNFALLAIDGSGQVTTGTMGGTVTVGGYATGQSPAEQVDISGLALEVSMQSCLSAARAVADGRFVADYPNSVATQYDISGSSRTVFDLYQADGTTLATTAADAVERRPR